MTEDQLRELFREMRDEPVPADSRARVRMAVAERTQSWRERVRAYWKFAAMVLVPVCAVVVALLTREQPVRISPPAPPVVAKQGAPPAEVLVYSPPRVVRVRHRIAKPAARQTEAATLIRIETADPDVVILLVGG